MPGSANGVDRKACIQTFGAALPGLAIESILDPDHPNQLRLHTWDGHKSATGPTVRHRGCTYEPAPIPSGLAQAVRFPTASKSFGSAARLTNSMLEFLTRYAHLLPDVVALLVAFAMASWFTDCVPVAPILYLLGPGNEARLVLRLLGCLCRRSALLADIDVPAIATLPEGLNPSLLICERNLAGAARRVLLASSSRYFHIAHGNGQLHTYGAKAFSVGPEFVDGTGVRISLSPALDPLPLLSDADEKDFARDFHAKLLRYRMVSYPRVRDVSIDTRDFVPAIRDEVRGWLGPICDCPDLLQSVRSSLLQQSRQLEGDRLSDDRCLAAEAALFFCHIANTEHFFVGDLAEKVTHLLAGRHEDRAVTAKMAGTLLRALGIHGERFTPGYKIVLTDALRQKIHTIARDYQVPATQDGVARCRYCADRQSDGGRNKANAHMNVCTLIKNKSKGA